MCTTDDKVCRLRNMFCKIKYIVFKIKIFSIAFFMFFQILKIRNRTHTKDITTMMTLSRRNIFLLIRLINELKVKPVLQEELLIFTKILRKLRFIIGVCQAIKWCFQCRPQSFLGIPVHVSALYLSETEKPTMVGVPITKHFRIQST